MKNRREIEEESQVSTPYGALLWKRTSRKTVLLEYDPSRGIILRTPFDFKESRVQEALQRKRRWIFRQRMNQETYSEMIRQNLLMTGGSYRFLGKSYRLKISEGSRNHCFMEGGRIHVLVTNNNQENVRKILKQWIRKEANRWVPMLLEKISSKTRELKQMEIQYSIKRMALRWGSCSTAKKIYINPDLMHAPLACVEYVIAHELAHLIYLNHTDHFFRFLEKISPQWKIWREKLHSKNWTSDGS